MNRYELDVSSSGGTHLLKVVIPSDLNRSAVIFRARGVAKALQNASSDRLQFNLTAWSEEGMPLNME